MADTEENSSVLYKEGKMMKTKILTKKHRIITDECRQNHGDIQALDIALGDIRESAKESMGRFSSGIKLHLKLEIERPVQ